MEVDGKEATGSGEKKTSGASNNRASYFRAIFSKYWPIGFIVGAFWAGCYLEHINLTKDINSISQENALLELRNKDLEKERDLLRTDKTTCYQEKSDLQTKIVLLEHEIDRQEKIIAELTPKQSSFPDVFVDGRVGKGLALGENTGKGARNWVEPVNAGGELCMAYPGGHGWGVVSITVGEPVSFGQRKGTDYSEYTKLVLELKGGEKNTTVKIGLKDTQDPDTGGETVVPLHLAEEWATYEIDLAQFKTANVKDLYVVTEFVFGNEPQSLCVRKVYFR